MNLQANWGSDNGQYKCSSLLGVTPSSLVHRFLPDKLYGVPSQKAQALKSIIDKKNTHFKFDIQKTVHRDIFL